MIEDDEMTARARHRGWRYPGRVAESPQPEIPVTPEHEYPDHVGTDEQRQRWDAARAVATQIFGEDDFATIWMATRAMYENPAFTL